MNALLVATSNPHKIDEIRAVLVPLGIDVIGLTPLRADLETVFMAVTRGQVQ